MVMVVVPAAGAAADGLRQILQVGQLTGLGCRREIAGELGELGGSCGIPLRLCRLGSSLEIRGDLRGYLFVLA